MPSRSKCRTTRRSPIVHPIPVALLSIAFYAYDYDSSTVDVHWDGIGKYLNFAFRYFAICCEVLFLIGSFKKKWINYMRPALYVVSFGAIFAAIIALSYCLGWDMTGGNQYHTNPYNGTHIEGLNKSTTIVPDIEASTTEDEPCPGGGKRMKIPQVYVLCLMRAFFAFFIWFMHFSLYTDKLDDIEVQESDESHNNMVPRVITSF